MAFLSVGSKLLTMLLLTGLLAVGVTTIVADYYGGQALEAAILNQMTTLREGKREEVVTYLNGLHNSFKLLSQTTTVEDALLQFSSAFSQLDEAPKAPPPPQLTRFYVDEFLPRLARTAFGAPSLDAYMPNGAAARLLQSEYIADVAPDARAVTEAGSPSGLYDRVHETYHRFFRNFVKLGGFSDVMLVNLKGDVVYETAKQTDFATNLVTGPYSRTGEARAFEKALDQHDHAAVIFEPYAPYAPEYFAPAAFFAAPVLKDGVLIGAVIAQFDPAGVNRVMNSNGRWREMGLGATGSAYLVGPDFLARSDDRNFIEDRAGFLARLRHMGVDDDQLNRIDAFGSTILALRVDTEAARAAQRGESGTGVITDYLNEKVLSSWAPVFANGVHWSVIAEMDSSEAFAPQIAFRRAMLIAAAAMAILLTLFSSLGARVFIAPIRAILASVKAFGGGDRHARAPQRGNDEFTELARGFNSMADEIEARNRRIHEKTEEYERLLKNIYPEFVAERLKLGQTNIAEVVRNVTVAVLTIDGLDALFQNKELPTVEAMNNIVDAFDAAAARHGVEKVKTFGGSYYAVCGLSTARLDHATRMVEFAEEACRLLARLAAEWRLPLALRAGLATGEVEAGLVGRFRTLYDLLGVTMMKTSRIAFEAGQNGIRVTAETFQALGDKNGFAAQPAIQAAALGRIESYERSVALADSVAEPKVFGLIAAERDDA